MHRGFDHNEYGTRISHHTCETCGQEFTLCPAQETDEHWKNCLDTDCTSYDPSRDVNKMIEDAGGDASRIVTRLPRGEA